MDSLLVRNVDFSSEFKSAIEQKQIAQQEAERKKYELEKERIEKERIRKKIDTSRAEFRRIKIPIR